MTITALRLLANHCNANARPLVSPKLLIPRPVMMAMTLRALNAMSGHSANRVTLTAQSRNVVIVIAKRLCRFERLSYRSKKTRLQEVIVDGFFEKVFRYCIIGGFLFIMLGVNMLQYPRDYWPPRKPGEQIPRPGKDTDIYITDWFVDLAKAFFTW